MIARRSSDRGLTRMRVASVALICALLGFSSALVSTSAAAQAVDCASQRPGQPTDYYTSIGCGLLVSVEQYHLGPGQEHLRQRRFQSAAGDFQFILAQYPNHPNALLLLVQTCEQWQGPAAALTCRVDEYFERAIAINPKMAGTFVTLGIYLYRAKNYKAAIESFKKALEINPDLTLANYNLGLTYLETKQYDLANQHAQRAYALGAQLPGLRNRLERAGQWKPTASGGTAPSTSDSRTSRKPPGGTTAN